MKKPPAFLRALEILADHREGLDPDEFYELMWPEQARSDTSVGGRSLRSGNTNGGPSRSQCAANWLLGRIGRKYPGSVYRYGFLDANRVRAGKWFIRAEGQEAIRTIHGQHQSAAQRR